MGFPLKVSWSMNSLRVPSRSSICTFVFFDDQVDGCIAPGDFAAVGTVTDVASSTREKVGVVDPDMDGTTEAIPLQAFGETGRVVLIGVAGELFHDREMYD